MGQSQSSLERFKPPQIHSRSAALAAPTRPVNISDFEIGVTIGKGAFGKVRTCVLKQTKTKYAVKYMNKAEVVARNAAYHVIGERRLLELVQSPFIVNMRYAFQDDENLLMVLDLKLGGDLRFHLTYTGSFPEERARFYFAEVACGLAYLHSHNIAHRDIKPDNILLDEFGHASITDFNVARVTSPTRVMNSRTGTARYMAPEVISKQEYSYHVDWWSLGVTTFEMLCGYPPFRAKHKEELFNQILYEPVQFFPLDAPIPPTPSKKSGTPLPPPAYPLQISAEAINFVTSLLAKPLTQRLGTPHTGGVPTIQIHPWFPTQDFWLQIYNKQIPVPYVPSVDKQKYYDPKHGLEEFFMGRSELPSVPVVRPSAGLSARPPPRGQMFSGQVGSGGSSGGNGGDSVLSGGTNMRKTRGTEGGMMKGSEMEEAQWTLLENEFLAFDYRIGSIVPDSVGGNAMLVDSVAVGA